MGRGRGRALPVGAVHWGLGSIGGPGGGAGRGHVSSCNCGGRLLCFGRDHVVMWCGSCPGMVVVVGLFGALWGLEGDGV